MKTKTYTYNLFQIFQKKEVTSIKTKQNPDAMYNFKEKVKNFTLYSHKDKTKDQTQMPCTIFYVPATFSLAPSPTAN